MNVREAIKSQIERGREYNANVLQQPHVNDLLPIEDMVDMVAIQLDAAAFKALANTKEGINIRQEKLLAHAKIDPKMKAMLKTIAQTQDAQNKTPISRLASNKIQELLGPNDRDSKASLYGMEDTSTKGTTQELRHLTGSLLSNMSANSPEVNTLKKYLNDNPKILGAPLMALAQQELQQEYSNVSAPSGCNKVIYGLMQNTESVMLKPERVHEYQDLINEIHNSLNNSPYLVLPKPDEQSIAATKDWTFGGSDSLAP